MRKIDYQTLATVIREERNRIMNAWFDDENERLRHIETLRRVAFQFATRGHVDRESFLKACEISP